MHDLDKRGRIAFSEAPSELRFLLEDLEFEPVPERLVDLARELQMRLATRRRTLDS